MAVAFRRDGKVLLSGGVGGVDRWDAASLDRLGAPMPHDGTVWTIRFSPDAARFLTVAGTPYRDYGEVRLWDAKSGRPLGPPLPQRVSVTAATFHPAGQLIATGGWEGDVRIWDVTSGRPVGPSLPLRGSVLAVAFDPSGRTLAAGGEGSTCRIWTVPDPADGPPERIRERIESLTGLTLDGDGTVRPRSRP